MRVPTWSQSHYSLKTGNKTEAKTQMDKDLLQKTGGMYASRCLLKDGKTFPVSITNFFAVFR